MDKPKAICVPNFFEVGSIGGINRLNISCKMSSLETICMKCQSLIAVKNILNLSSADSVQKVVKFNTVSTTFTMLACKL